MDLDLFPLPSDRTVVASVADLDDTVIATIYRQVEPIVAAANVRAVVISFTGDLDCDTSPYLEYALHRAISGGTAVCCDLDQAGYIGSEGARVILSALRQAGDAGGTFLLRGVHGMSRRVLAAVGVDQSLIIS